MLDRRQINSFVSSLPLLSYGLLNTKEDKKEDVVKSPKEEESPKSPHFCKFIWKRADLNSNTTYSRVYGPLLLEEDSLDVFYEGQTIRRFSIALNCTHEFAKLIIKNSKEYNLFDLALLYPSYEKYYNLLCYKNATLFHLFITCLEDQIDLSTQDEESEFHFFQEYEFHFQNPINEWNSCIVP